MSVEQKIGQLFVLAWEATHSLDEFISLAESYDLGGVMVLRPDVSPGELAVLTQALTQRVGTHKMRPFVAIDAEPTLLPNRGLRPTGGEREMELGRVAREIARLLKDYGYTVNLAPVYDSNQNKTVIGERSFGSSPQEIIPQASLFAREMRKEGIIPTAKHFPGHGYAQGDTHQSLEFIPSDLPELDSFRSAVAEGIPLVMIGHLGIEGGAYDTEGLPATLSPVVMETLLREELGFQGIVLTDAMNMGALEGLEEVDRRALLAGADLVLMPRDVASAYPDLRTLYLQDPVWRERINEKLYRLVRLKLVSQWQD